MNDMRNNSDYGGMSRDALLRRIQELSFVALESNLFLDTHPDCKMAREKFHTAHDELALATEVYEYTYGPITCRGASADGWNWIDGPWPWQMDNGAMGKAGK